MENIFVRYINLDIRSKRSFDAKNKLLNLGFTNEQIKRYSAINGYDIKNDLINKNLMDDILIKTICKLNISYNVGALGCLLSHYFLLKEIYEDNLIDGNAIIFIFEDDFFVNEKYVSNETFKSIMEKLFEFNNLNDWDLIYFGGRFDINFMPNSNELNKFFKKIDNNFYLRTRGIGMPWDRTTHNYVIKKKHIHKILSIIIDNFELKDYKPHIDHILTNTFNKSKLNSYDYFPHIFYSPRDFETDIQRNVNKINTGTLFI